MPGRINSVSSSSSDDSHYNGPHSTEYDSYLAKTSIPSRTSIVFSGVAAGILTATFICTLVFVLATGNSIYDDDGNDCTVFFLVIMGFLAVMFVLIFHRTLAKFKATFGTNNLLEDPEFADRFVQGPQWEEINGNSHPAHRRNRSSRFPVALTALCTLISLGAFVYYLVRLLILAGKWDHSPPQEYSPHLGGVAVSLMAFGIFGYAFKRALSKYLYYSLFSNEPMVTGVYEDNEILP